MDPKEAKSSWAPRGFVPGPVHPALSGGESDSFAHEIEKPGAVGGLCL